MRSRSLMKIALRLMGNLITDEDADAVARLWRVAGKASLRFDDRPLRRLTAHRAHPRTRAPAHRRTRHIRRKGHGKPSASPSEPTGPGSSSIATPPT